MSVAGTRSNRGDTYQVAVALREAVMMLSRPERAWLELDSTRLMRDNTPISVDDIVVGYQDGRMVCIQCKKNHPNFKTWSVSDLSEELLKAAKLLAVEPDATVRFYSRADFGELAKIREKTAETGRENSFLLNVGNDLQPTLNALTSLLSSVPNAPSPFKFLQRVRFTPTRETEDIQEETRVLLRAIVTREPDAFNALWRTFDEFGAKLGSEATVPAKSHFTKFDLVELIGTAGCALSPSRALADIEKEFAALSSVGRQWPRDIGGTYFDREAVEKLLDCVDQKMSTVLLTDGPGSGKTCVLLSLVDELQVRPMIASVFIQAREFADSRTSEDRSDLGFPKDFFAAISTASEHKHVVVVIDSLDVLSLARDSERLRFFLALIDRLAVVPNVTIIVACRDFDLKYNFKLKARKWTARIEVGLLDWAGSVKPTLNQWGVHSESIDSTTQTLLQNPRNLALYREIVERGGGNNAVSSQDLTEHYLDTVILADERLGDVAMEGIERIASIMLTKRRLDVDQRAITLNDEVVQSLLSARVLFSGRTGSVGFGHQTLLDALAVRDARRKGLSLVEFIQGLPAVPFVRPAVRAFFVHLRSSDIKNFRAQTRAALDSAIAFHLKRLLTESLAEVDPEPDDWNLVRHLYKCHDHLFRVLYSSVKSVQWFHFLHSRLVPMWEAESNSEWLRIHIRRVEAWVCEDDDTVISFWEKAARSNWFAATARRQLISLQLHGDKPRNWAKFLPLLDALVQLPSEDHDFIGQSIEKAIMSTGDGDEVLWKYVTQDVTDQAVKDYKFASALRAEHSFDDKDFLSIRFEQSEWLLDQAVAALERWSMLRNYSEDEPEDDSELWNIKFVELTSRDLRKTEDDRRFRSSGEIFIGAIEQSIVRHAAQGSDWWKRNRMCIGLNPCGALRHIGVAALTEHPQGNEELATAVLSRVDSYLNFDTFQLVNLIRAAAYFVPDSAEKIESGIRRRVALCGESDEAYANEEKFQLFSSIPGPFRTVEVGRELKRLERELGFPYPTPRDFYSFDWAKPPMTVEELVALSDGALRSLLQAAADPARGGFEYFRPVGRGWQLAGQLQTAATKQPSRFIAFLTHSWDVLDNRFQAAIFEGLAKYLRHERGDLQLPQDSISTEQTDCNNLAMQMLHGLERHEFRWRWTSEGAEALRGCAHCLAKDDELAERLVFWAAGSVNAENPDCDAGAKTDLETFGSSSVRGILADALMVIATERVSSGLNLPPLLMPLLIRLSNDPIASVRVMVLKRLAFFISKSPTAWVLLENIVKCDDVRIWRFAESCLYYFYKERMLEVKPMLEAMKATRAPFALESWARISALATLSNRIDIDAFNADLKLLGNESAWKGACIVWFANSHRIDLMATWISGLTAALQVDEGANHVLQSIYRLFKNADGGPALPIPLAFLRLALQRADELQHRGGLHGLEKWCFELSDTDPMQALEVSETLAKFADEHHISYDGPEALPGLLTALFREAEEKEGTDGGAMLQRVIALQDKLLHSNHDHLTRWLRAAERQES